MGSSERHAWDGEKAILKINDQITNTKFQTNYKFKLLVSKPLGFLGLFGTCDLGFGV